MGDDLICAIFLPPAQISHADQAVPLLPQSRDSSERSFGIISVAVGTVIAGRPPHRSVRAELPHTAPTLDE
jgi:hypothetical protein